MRGRYTLARCAWLVAVATGLSGGFARAQTSTYSTAGVFTNVVPAGATVMRVKLWGAGGGNGGAAAGGGGAFAQSTYFVSEGQTYVVVVGQRGAYESTGLGGAGSGNTEGGAPGYLGDYNGRGQGGQASSLFELTNGVFITRIVAGAGGGAGIFGNGGAGGQDGADNGTAFGGDAGINGIGGAGGGTGHPGSNYSSDATSTGIASLSLAQGNGGAASNWSGGGGGGYGGGGGGGGGTGGNSGGGGGGGSLGDLIVLGNGTSPGNTADTNYVASTAGAAQDGLAVVIFGNGVPPVADTVGITNIGLHSGYAHGTANPGAASTAAWFEYGTSTLYGATSATSLLSPDLSNLTVTAPLLNLSLDTLYHYRLVASNAYGLSIGDDLTFLTKDLTNAFGSSGIYTQVVPVGIAQMIVKLWGAGGGGSSAFISAGGGGGAFSSVALDVVPGDEFVLVVGQRGQVNGAGLGGVNDGISQGGSPGFAGDYNNRAQGGQASSLFKQEGGLFYMRAVAGAGGGAGISVAGGAGGQAGANGGATGGQPGSNGAGGSGGSGAAPGGDYDISAITNGIAALNLANGNGGNGGTYSGGGGGGYGGGGGGGVQGVSGAGGGGGGSYGDTVIAGSGTSPGNTGDPSYNGSSGAGGSGNANGNDGLIVIQFIPASPESQPVIDSAATTDGGSFLLTFTNTPDLLFSALATTNLLTPVSDWTLLGPAFETAPGQFEFADPQSADPIRFYMIRSP